MALAVTLRVVSKTDDEHQRRRRKRFNQSLKMEAVYRKHYASPGKARDSLEVFRRRYNGVCLHWALVPPESGVPVTLAKALHSSPVGCPPHALGRPKMLTERECTISAGCPCSDVGFHDVFGPVDSHLRGFDDR